MKDSGESWQYDFWPTGDRYSKTDLNQPSNNEYYVTRGNDVVTDYSSPIQLKNSYVQGTGIDMKQCRIAAGGLRRHYLGDTVGTVSITLTDTGSVAETSLKDVWGVQISGNTSSERYGYANPWHVKELLGHEDFRSLDVYARLTILDLKAAHRKHHPREHGGSGESEGSSTE